MHVTSRFLRSALVAAAIVLFAATGGASASVRSSAAASPAVDVEIAVDTTGSMAPSVARAKALGVNLVAGVVGDLPNAHIAVVQFRDPGNPAGEYQLLQPMTADPQAVTAAIGKLATSQNPTPGNVAEESYNLAFHQSWADTRMGWRTDSRKVVVVIGDAEPFGAGAAGLAGCKSSARDPHGYNTAKELDLMAQHQRTLVFVRAVSPATSASLACYRSMAARAYPGGTAVDDAAAGNLSVSVQRLVETGIAPLKALVTPLFSAPGSTVSVAVTLRNPNPFAFTLHNVTFTLPTGFTLAAGQQQWSIAAGGKIQLSGDVAVPKSATVSARLKSPAAATKGSLLATTTVVLPDGNSFDETATVALATAKSYKVGTPVGSVVVTFARRSTARGTLRVGSGKSAWRLRLSTAALSQTSASSRLVLAGGWAASRTCTASRGQLVATLRRDPATGRVRLSYTTTRACRGALLHRRGTVTATVSALR